MHSRAKKTNKMHARTASRIGNNQKCPCGSKKKYKKCCKKNVILNKADKIHSWQTKKGTQSGGYLSRNGGLKSAKVIKLANHMTPFKFWCITHVKEFDFNPATNDRIITHVKKHYQMIEEYKCPKFVASHPKHVKLLDLLTFQESRDGKLVRLKNTNIGWYSHCFQNSFFYTKFKGCGKPKIGWLVTGFPREVKCKVPEVFAKHQNGEAPDMSFSAELHVVWEAPDGELIDPTEDYNPTIDSKIFIEDPKLQKMLDMNNCFDNFSKYIHVVGTIQQMTPLGSGFLHKNNMKTWKCPIIMIGY
tara:strand:+ start:73 stop:978 length:906 start_codon:yes stop_codon:yes gene_type:complete